MQYISPNVVAMGAVIGQTWLLLVHGLSCLDTLRNNSRYHSARERIQQYICVEDIVLKTDTTARACRYRVRQESRMRLHEEKKAYAPHYHATTNCNFLQSSLSTKNRSKARKGGFSRFGIVVRRFFSSQHHLPVPGTILTEKKSTRCSGVSSRTEVHIA